MRARSSLPRYPRFYPGVARCADAIPDQMKRITRRRKKKKKKKSDAEENANRILSIFRKLADAEGIHSRPKEVDKLIRINCNGTSTLISQRRTFVVFAGHRLRHRAYLKRCLYRSRRRGPAEPVFPVILSCTSWIEVSLTPKLDKPLSRRLFIHFHQSKFSINIILHFRSTESGHWERVTKISGTARERQLETKRDSRCNEVITRSP